MSSFKTIAQILEGHANKALGKVGLLPEDTLKLSEIRFAHCLFCHLTPRPAPGVGNGPGMREEKYCNACGCDMEAKTKVIDAKCPIERW